MKINSTSKIRKTIEIKKNRIEKGRRAESLGVKVIIPPCNTYIINLYALHRCYKRVCRNKVFRITKDSRAPKAE
jgi:2-methylisocitrate lyase-like PEP mutase family enzyme